MNIKKLKCLLFTASFIIAFSTSVNYVCAENVEVDEFGTISRIADYMDTVVKNESQKTVLNSNTDIDTTITEYSIDNIYKTYTLENFMLTHYNKGANFSDLIGNEYKWNIPVKNKLNQTGIAFLTENEKGFDFIGSMFNKKPLVIPENKDVIVNKLNEYFKENPENIQSIIYTHSNLYKTTIIYAKTDKSEYLIPYSNISSKLGITNGKIYKDNMLLKIFNEKFDESVFINSGESNGGLPYRKKENYIPSLITFITIVGMGIGITNIVRLKRNMKSQVI